MEQKHIERFSRLLEIAQPVTQEVIDKLPKGKTFEGGKSIEIGDKVIPVIKIIDKKMELLLFHYKDITKYNFILHEDDNGKDLFIVKEVNYVG